MIARRRRHAHERGLTLIEMIVAIIVLTVGFVALLSGFAFVERQSSSTHDDAQLATLARQVTSVIESAPRQGGASYVLCSPPAGPWASGSYQAQLNANSNINSVKGTDTITIVSVAQAQGAASSHVLSPGGTSALAPVSGCGAGTGSSSPDYGVQEIVFMVTSTQGANLTRTVYKRWN